ncbi:guanylate kinase [Isosphaeraceae bacterium EP7]
MRTHTDGDGILRETALTIDERTTNAPASAPAASGRLVVVSGPSGTGKSTLVRRVVEQCAPGVVLSISATSRAPRVGEVDGVDYLFLSREDFEQAIARGEFLEWAEVHGNLYGTPAGPVAQAVARGCRVLLEIDVQGGMQVRSRVPDAFLIFVHAPSFEVLEARLRARGTDGEATILRRLANARAELEQSPRYDVQLVNDDLDRAVAELADVLGRLSPGSGGS